MLCKRCLIPDNFPHIRFDKSGVCNLCRAYKGKVYARHLRKVYRGRFERLIKRVAGKEDYDVLMCYSGGKDSTYALSLLKNRYRLKILAFTFDNGFIPERTYLNIRNVVEKLDVDYMLFKPRFKVIRCLFRFALKRHIYPIKTLERASSLCTSCIGLVKYISLKVAIEKNIPIVAFGWSPGQAPVTSSILELRPSMLRSMRDAIRSPLRRVFGKEIDIYFPDILLGSNRQVPILVHPLAFFPYDEKKVFRMIRTLGWIKPKGVGPNATNCLINALADIVHTQKYGFHPYVLEISALVREGYMSRKEGLRHLSIQKDKRLLRMLKRRLDIK